MRTFGPVTHQVVEGYGAVGVIIQDNVAAVPLWSLSRPMMIDSEVYTDDVTG